MEPWDPLADPADVAAGALRPGPRPGPVRPGVAAASADGGGCEEVESISALLGPLGREAALSSHRMRAVEEWIWKAEASGLRHEEILPARERLRDLAGSNRSIHWKREEEREAKQKAESVQMEAQDKLEGVMIEVDRFMKRRDAGASPGGRVELETKLKDAIAEAYSAKVNVQLLISARHKVLKLQGSVEAKSRPPAEGATKRSLAKEMLQALKEKDASALRRVLEDALQQGVQLQGLEVARKKLAEWDVTATESRPVVAPVAPQQQQLRVILPDGRRGWLKVDLQWPGRNIMSCLPKEVGLHFTLAQEGGHRGQVTLLQQPLDLDRPLSEQPQFFAEGAALACRSTSEATLWEDVMKGLSEPFPAFAQVQKLLGDLAAGGFSTSLVLAWEVRRWQEAVDLLGASHLVLVSKSTDVEPLNGSPVEKTVLNLDTDAVVEGDVMAKIINHIKGRAPRDHRPLLLVLLCRGYLSRRLVLSFRKHLPEDMILFPLPSDLATATAEAPGFAAECFQEARRLQMEGVHLPESCLQALDRS